MAAMVDMFVNENRDKLPALYWLHKLHKITNKSRFVAELLC